MTMIGMEYFHEMHSNFGGFLKKPFTISEKKYLFSVKTIFTSKARASILFGG